MFTKLTGMKRNEVNTFANGYFCGGPQGVLSIYCIRLNYKIIKKNKLLFVSVEGRKKTGRPIPREKLHKRAKN